MKPSILKVFLSLLMVLEQGMLNAGLESVPMRLRPHDAALTLPAGTGRISASYEGRGGAASLVILIRDVHAHPEVQKNISRILKHLKDKHRVTRVFLEGAEGPLDTSFIDALPDENVRRGIARRYLEKGVLTGAEALKISEGSQSELFLWGAEDSALYVANFESFRRVCADSRLHAFIQSAAGVLERLESRVFPPAFIQWLALERDFKSGSLNLEQYWKRLKKFLRRGENLTRYPAILLFDRMRDLEREIVFPELEKEQGRLIQLLSTQLPKSALQDLVRMTLKMRLGQTDETEYFEWLRERTGERFKSFVHLDRYARLVDLRRSLDFESLMSEMSRLSRKAGLRLLQASDQKKFFRLVQHFELWRSFLSLKSSRSQIRDLGKLDFEHWLAQLGKITIQYGEAPGALGPLVNGSKDLLSHAADFYEYALQRDEALVENTLAAMDGPGVLITGGFHTEGIERILRERAISYRVITPRMTRMFDGGPYEDLMLDPHVGVARRRPLPQHVLALKVLSGVIAGLEDHRGIKAAMARDALEGLAEKLKRKESSLRNLDDWSRAIRGRWDPQKVLDAASVKEILFDVLKEELELSTHEEGILLEYLQSAVLQREGLLTDVLPALLGAAGREIDGKNIAEPGITELQDIHEDILSSIRGGDAIAVRFDDLAFDFDRMSTRRLARLLTADIDGIPVRSRDRLESALARPSVRRRILNALENLRKVVEAASVGSLRATRFFILLSSKGPFFAGDVLGHTGAGRKSRVNVPGTIYLHLDTLARSQEDPEGFRLFLEHEAADLARGRHAYRSSREREGLADFWERLYPVQWTTLKFPPRPFADRALARGRIMPAKPASRAFIRPSERRMPRVEGSGFSRKIRAKLTNRVEFVKEGFRLLPPSHRRTVRGVVIHNKVLLALKGHPEGVRGYCEQDGTVHLPGAERFIRSVLYHEVGHALYFRGLSVRERKKFESLYIRSRKDLKHFVNEDAMKDAHEDFAETYEMWAVHSKELLDLLGTSPLLDEKILFAAGRFMFSVRGKTYLRLYDNFEPLDIRIGHTLRRSPDSAALRAAVRRAFDDRTLMGRNFSLSRLWTLATSGWKALPVAQWMSRFTVLKFFMTITMAVAAACVSSPPKITANISISKSFPSIETEGYEDKDATLRNEAVRLVREHWTRLPETHQSAIAGGVIRNLEKLPHADYKDGVPAFFDPDTGKVHFAGAKLPAVATIYHEAGHAYYYRAMEKTDREAFKALHEKGGKERKHYVSEYAMKNDREDFAETYEEWAKNSKALITSSAASEILSGKSLAVARSFVTARDGKFYLRSYSDFAPLDIEITAAQAKLETLDVLKKCMEGAKSEEKKDKPSGTDRAGSDAGSPDSGLIGKWEAQIRQYPTLEKSQVIFDLAGIGSKAGLRRRGVQIETSPLNTQQREQLFKTITEELLPQARSLTDPERREHAVGILNHLLTHARRVWLMDDDDEIQGFGDRNMILVNRRLFESPAGRVALFHEAGHSYFDANASFFKAGRFAKRFGSVHEYLRGAGKSARGARTFAQLEENERGLQDDLFGDRNAILTQEISRISADVISKMRERNLKNLSRRRLIVLAAASLAAGAGLLAVQKRAHRLSIEPSGYSPEDMDLFLDGKARVLEVLDVLPLDHRMAVDKVLIHDQALLPSRKHKDGVPGNYRSGEIHLAGAKVPEKSTVFHEAGHAVYDRVLTSSNREDFKALTQAAGTEREHYITDYARTDHLENFAETYEYWGRDSWKLLEIASRSRHMQAFVLFTARTFVKRRGERDYLRLYEDFRPYEIPLDEGERLLADFETLEAVLARASSRRDAGSAFPDSGLIGKWQAEVRKYPSETDSNLVLDLTGLGSNEGRARRSIHIRARTPSQRDLDAIQRRITEELIPRSRGFSDAGRREQALSILEYLTASVDKIRLLAPDEDVLGFGDKHIIAVNETLFRSPGGIAALFHEAGHSFFDANPRTAASVSNAFASVHEMLRGAGKTVRADRPLEELPPEERGLQDDLFGAVNERLSEEIRKIAGDIRASRLKSLPLRVDYNNQVLLPQEPYTFGIGLDVSSAPETSGTGPASAAPGTSLSVYSAVSNGAMAPSSALALRGLFSTGLRMRQALFNGLMGHVRQLAATGEVQRAVEVLEEGRSLEEMTRILSILYENEGGKPYFIELLSRVDPSVSAAFLYAQSAPSGTLDLAKLKETIYLLAVMQPERWAKLHERRSDVALRDAYPVSCFVLEEMASNPRHRVVFEAVRELVRRKNEDDPLLELQVPGLAEMDRILEIIATEEIAQGRTARSFSRIVREVDAITGRLVERYPLLMEIQSSDPDRYAFHLRELSDYCVVGRSPASVLLALSNLADLRQEDIAHTFLVKLLNVQTPEIVAAFLASLDFEQRLPFFARESGVWRPSGIFAENQRYDMGDEDHRAAYCSRVISGMIQDRAGPAVSGSLLEISSIDPLAHVIHILATQRDLQQIGSEALAARLIRQPDLDAMEAIGAVYGRLRENFEGYTSPYEFYISGVLRASDLKGSKKEQAIERCRQVLDLQRYELENPGLKARRLMKSIAIPPWAGRDERVLLLHERQKDALRMLAELGGSREIDFLSKLIWDLGLKWRSMRSYPMVWTFAMRADLAPKPDLSVNQQGRLRNEAIDALDYLARHSPPEVFRLRHVDNLINAAGFGSGFLEPRLNEIQQRSIREILGALSARHHPVLIDKVIDRFRKSFFRRLRRGVARSDDRFDADLELAAVCFSPEGLRWANLLGGLVRNLGNSDPAVRDLSAESLRRLGVGSQVTDAIARLFDAASADAGSEGQRAFPDVIRDLSLLGPAADLPVGQLLVHSKMLPEKGSPDRFWAVRQAAAIALGEFGTSRSVSSLVKGLRDPSQSVVLASVRSLGKAGGPFEIRPLHELYQSPNWYVREAAVGAVGSIGLRTIRRRLDLADIYLLVEALRDPDESVRDTAFDALVRLGQWILEPLQERLARDERTLGARSAHTNAGIYEQQFLLRLREVIEFIEAGYPPPSSSSPGAGAIGKWTVSVKSTPTVLDPHFLADFRGIQSQKGKRKKNVRIRARPLSEEEKLNLLARVGLDIMPRAQLIKDSAKSRHAAAILKHLQSNLDKVWLCEDNADLAGYGDSNIILLSESLFRMDSGIVGLFHEAGHSYFHAHPGEFEKRSQPEMSATVHQYLRGPGKKEREGDVLTGLAPDEKGLQDELFPGLNVRFSEEIARLRHAQESVLGTVGRQISWIRRLLGRSRAAVMALTVGAATLGSCTPARHHILYVPIVSENVYPVKFEDYPAGKASYTLDLERIIRAKYRLLPPAHQDTIREVVVHNKKRLPHPEFKDGVAGIYKIKEDEIHLAGADQPGVGTIFHEAGHAVYDQILTDDERKAYKALHDKGIDAKGAKERTHFITDYSMKDDWEDFAEIYEEWVSRSGSILATAEKSEIFADKALFVVRRFVFQHGGKTYLRLYKDFDPYDVEIPSGKEGIADLGALKELAALTPVKLPADFGTTGHIQQGERSVRVFEARLESIRKAGVSSVPAARLVNILRRVLDQGYFENDERDEVQKLMERVNAGEYRTYAFESIVEGPDDFFLGRHDPAAREIFISKDLLDKLETSGVQDLADHYLAHELIDPILGHYPAIISQQNIFPEHFPDAAALREQTDFKPYKGVLGEFIRAHIDRRLKIQELFGRLRWDLYSLGYYSIPFELEILDRDPVPGSGRFDADENLVRLYTGGLEDMKDVARVWWNAFKHWYYAELDRQGAGWPKILRLISTTKSKSIAANPEFPIDAMDLRALEEAIRRLGTLNAETRLSAGMTDLYVLIDGLDSDDVRDASDALFEYNRRLDALKEIYKFRRSLPDEAVYWQGTSYLFEILKEGKLKSMGIGRLRTDEIIQGIYVEPQREDAGRWRLHEKEALGYQKIFHPEDYDRARELMRAEGHETYIPDVRTVEDLSPVTLENGGPIGVVIGVKKRFVEFTRRNENGRLMDEEGNPVGELPLDAISEITFYSRKDFQVISRVLERNGLSIPPHIEIRFESRNDEQGYLNIVEAYLASYGLSMNAGMRDMLEALVAGRLASPPYSALRKELVLSSFSQQDLDLVRDLTSWIDRNLNRPRDQKTALAVSAGSYVLRFRREQSAPAVSADSGLPEIWLKDLPVRQAPWLHFIEEGLKKAESSA